MAKIYMKLDGDLIPIAGGNGGGEYTETDPIFTAWDKSTGISITKSQVSDLIEATQSLSGLMSATDKQRLDVLHALLEEDEENNVVDTINEVLAIFNNYPEGADLVSALAGKVDKVEGKGLSTNDYTTAEKTKLSGIETGAQVNKVNSVNTKQGAVVLNQDDIGDGSTYKRVTTAEKNTWNDKQDKLTAGTNITIDENNVISASGGGGDYELTKSKIETALVGTSDYSIQLGDNATAGGTNSTAFGRIASASGVNAIAIGFSATASANYTTAVGTYAEASVQGATAVGSEAEASHTATVAVGTYAEATGFNSTALGSSTKAGGINSTALGFFAQTGDSNNLMQLGSTSLSTLRSEVQLTVTSDIRDKADIEEVPKALDFIKDLNPITYVGNSRDKYISDEQKETDTYRNFLMVEDYDRESHSQGTKKGSRRRVGLSAQEVREKLIEHYGSDNYANVVNDNFVEFKERGLDIPEGLENKLTMSYETMVPFLIKAIQEQQEQIEELKNKLKEE